jgi:hypothetical protein
LQSYYHSGAILCDAYTQEGGQSQTCIDQLQDQGKNTRAWNFICWWNAITFLDLVKGSGFTLLMPDVIANDLTTHFEAVEDSIRWIFLEAALLLEGLVCRVVGVPYIIGGAPTSLQKHTFAFSTSIALRRTANSLLSISATGSPYGSSGFTWGGSSGNLKPFHPILTADSS